jgi:hypothetical protein
VRPDDRSEPPEFISDDDSAWTRLRRRLEVVHRRRPGYRLQPIDPDHALPSVTHADFISARARTPYLKRRWNYYREAISIAKRLAPRRVLEIGTAYIPLFPVSDRLDYKADFHPTFLHDATVVPWPIADQAYDLVVALQVWEHLGNRQREAFSELPRVARYALLSLPYRWRSRTNISHSGIDDQVVLRWSDGRKPVETIELPHFGRRRRKIYLFDFMSPG